MTIMPAASSSLGGSRLAVPRHVCTFFSSDDESCRLLLPFIAKGFECGHKAVHVLRPERQADHLQNPFFVPPERILRERAGREGADWPSS